MGSAGESTGAVIRMGRFTFKNDPMPLKRAACSCANGNPKRGSRLFTNTWVCSGTSMIVGSR